METEQPQKPTQTTALQSGLIKQVFFMVVILILVVLTNYAVSHLGGK